MSSEVLELHLFETHNVRSNKMINDAINEGKRLGAKLYETSMRKLELEYSKYSEKDKISSAVQDKTVSGRPMGGVMPWSQPSKHLFSFEAPSSFRKNCSYYWMR